MDKKILEELIGLGDSHRKMSNKLNVSESTIRYWLSFYSLKTKNKQYNNKGKEKLITEKKCPKCNNKLPLEDFYLRSDRKTTTGYCKKCSTNYHRERLEKVKIKMINYKGGKCKRCNLMLDDSNYCVFDFHHTNPNEKDKNFHGLKHRKWEFIKKEIDKCILVCSNCHRIIHLTNI